MLYLFLLYIELNLFDMKCILAIIVAIVTMNDYICCHFKDSILVDKEVGWSQLCTSVCKCGTYICKKDTEKLKCVPENDTRFFCEILAWSFECITVIIAIVHECIADDVSSVHLEATPQPIKYSSADPRSVQNQSLFYCEHFVFEWPVSMFWSSAGSRWWTGSLCIVSIV